MRTRGTFKVPPCLHRGAHTSGRLAGWGGARAALVARLAPSLVPPSRAPACSALALFAARMANKFDRVHICNFFGLLWRNRSIVYAFFARGTACGGDHRRCVSVSPDRKKSLARHSSSWPVRNAHNRTDLPKEGRNPARTRHCSGEPCERGAEQFSAPKMASKVDWSTHTAGFRLPERALGRRAQHNPRSRKVAPGGLPLMGRSGPNLSH